MVGMSEQAVEQQVQPKAGEFEASSQPNINYAELTAFLDKYFENKIQTQQKVDQAMQHLNASNSVMDNSNLSMQKPLERWEDGLSYLKGELAQTIDRIKDLLNYEDYDSAAFDSNFGGDLIKKYRQFWLHANILGGEKMADMMVDRIRRSRKDYTIFNKSAIYR